MRNYDPGVHAKRTGEKTWPLLLQSWYRLSDPGLAEQLAVDLLFRRFIGLEISESVPEHSRLWCFRQKLEESSLLERLLPEVNEQLAGQGLYMKSGAVSIEASVIEAKQRRPKREKKEKTRKTRQRLTSIEDGFIRATDYSTGSLHDS